MTSPLRRRRPPLSLPPLLLLAPPTPPRTMKCRLWRVRPAPQLIVDLRTDLYSLQPFRTTSFQLLELRLRRVLLDPLQPPPPTRTMRCHPWKVGTLSIFTHAHQLTCYLIAAISDDESSPQASTSASATAQPSAGAVPRATESDDEMPPLESEF